MISKLVLQLTKVFQIFEFYKKDFVPSHEVIELSPINHVYFLREVFSQIEKTSLKSHICKTSVNKTCMLIREVFSIFLYYRSLLYILFTKKMYKTSLVVGLSKSLLRKTHKIVNCKTNILLTRRFLNQKVFFVYRSEKTKIIPTTREMPCIISFSKYTKLRMEDTHLLLTKNQEHE